MRTICTFLLLLLPALCQSVKAQYYQIGHVSATFTDAARSNRPVPVEIYYPADATGDNVAFATAITGRVPVITFGHGFVMTIDAYTNIRNAVVSRGFIIAFPTTEGSFSPSHGTFAQDLVFTMGQVTALGGSASSPLYGHTDTMNCVMGHSMGGGAAMLAAATAGSGIKSMLTFAPAETTPSAITAAANVTIPSLIFAGNNDCVTPPATNQRPMYDGLTSACRQYIGIKGGSHCQMAGTSTTCSFGEGTCTPAPTISRATQHAVIDTFMVPWLRYTLMGSCTDGAIFDTRLATDTSVTSLSTCALCSPAATSVSTTAIAATVLPNPANNWMHILCTDKRYTYLQLLSPDGRILIAAPWLPGMNIPTEHLPHGLYLYKLSGNNVPAISGRVVIQH